MKLRAYIGLLVAAIVQAGPAVSAAQAPAALQVTAPVSLRDCSPVTLAPCLTLSVTPSDAGGAPAAVLLPPQNRLAKAVSVQTSTGTITPFYVKADTGSGAIRSRVVLIEVDISGSMNQQTSTGASRFAAARQAIASYLTTMQDGVDEVAIVPFESHDVVPTIQASVFTTKRDQAIGQLNALPQPGPKKNTALYQAVYTGVDTLDAELKRLQKSGISRSSVIPQLVVMTDGKNDLLPGDDPGLLDGPLGLEQAVAKVRAAGVEVVGIGFGDPADIDTDALRRLSTRFFLASDPGQLAHALQSSVPARPGNLEIAFLAPGRDRASLAAHNTNFVITLHLPDGQTLASPAITYAPPAMSLPLYEGHIGYAGLKALSAAEPPALSGWSSVLRGILIFAGLGVVWLLLWFWLPRIVWQGERPGLSTAFVRSNGDRKFGVQASGVQVRDAPAGFEADPGFRAPQRTAAQTTQVRLRADLTHTETAGRR